MRPLKPILINLLINLLIGAALLFCGALILGGGNALLNAADSEVSLDLLSMGMTQDFEVAVEEGANIVRIGTAIFSA